MLRLNHEWPGPQNPLGPVGNRRRSGGWRAGLLGGAGLWLLLGGLASAEPPAPVPAPAAPAATAAKDGAARKAPAAASAVAPGAAPGAAPGDSGRAGEAVAAQKPKPRPVLDPQRVVPATWTGTPTGGAAADGGRDRRPAAAPAVAAPGADAAVARRVGPAAAGPGAGSRARLPLAPSAAEIERERAEQKLDPAAPAAPAAGAPPASTGDRLQQRATATPTQDRRWPTSSPSTQGAGGSLGPRTMADRKGALQDASGPQQGVIRNRW